MTRILKIAFLYFGIVFGVGFLLGLIRVPLLVPRFGERIAEMIELPFMLTAIFFAARWITHRYGLRSNLATAFAVGLISAVLLLLLEFSVVLWLRGLTIYEFLASRDPVAAILYHVAVGIFALMPGILSLTKRRDS